MKTYIIARNKDNKVYRFEYSEDMLASQLPHRHVSAYPFDGNFYIEGVDYQPKKGVEIEDKYDFLTYENSPVLVIEDKITSCISLSNCICVKQAIHEILNLLNEINTKY